MDNRLGEEKVHKLLWELSIPAILGMLSNAIFNVVDRIFVGRIDPLALYSGSLVKTKIQDFYNELIWLISDKEQGENSGILPRSIYALSYIW